MRQAIGLCVLTLLMIMLVVPAPAGADIVMRKKVLRHFPDLETCPFVNELELSFIAGGPNAILTFSATGVESEPFQIDGVAVVDKETFVGNFFANVAQDCMNGALAFYEGTPTDVDLTDDASLWSLSNASVDNGLRLGINSGNDQASASVRVTGLVPGRQYFVTGWSNRGSFDVEVNSLLPTEFFLANHRFQVQVRWDASAKLPGVLTYSEKTAGLWLNDPTQIEMLVSVTNHCNPRGGTFWVMFAGTTAQKLRITVKDMVTQIQKTYLNGTETRLKTVVDKTTFRCSFLP